MKRNLLLVPLGVAVAVAAWAMQTGLPRLNDYSSTLNSAAGLKATMNMVAVGGARSGLRIEAAKPNLLRYENSERLVVSDGTDIYLYLKGQNVYLKEPVSEGMLMKALADDAAMLFRPFFKGDSLNKLGGLKDLGTTSRKGETVGVFSATVDPARGVTAKVMVGKDNLLRQAEFTNPKGATSVLDVQSISLDAPKADRFKFVAPEGSKQVTEAELNADKWYDDINEALKIAASTNRMVMVDFMFEGCVWCEKLDAEVFASEAFMNKVKGNFVLCRIDFLKFPAKAQGYGVSGAPDIRFLRKDGTEAHKIGGYVPLDRFLAEMDKALANR